MKKKVILIVLTVFIVIFNSSCSIFCYLVEALWSAYTGETSYSNLPVYGWVIPPWVDYCKSIEDSVALFNSQDLQNEAVEEYGYDGYDILEEDSSALSGSMPIANDDQEQYFDSTFDGAWFGYIEVKYPKIKYGYEKTVFLLTLSLNAQKRKGLGSARTMDFFQSDQSNSPQWITFYIHDFKIKKNKITLNFDSDSFKKYFKEDDEKDYSGSITAFLNGDTLTGNYQIEPGKYPKGEVKFVRMDADWPWRGLWIYSYMDNTNTEQFWPLFLWLNHNQSTLDCKLVLLFMGSQMTNSSFINNVLKANFAVGWGVLNTRLIYKNNRLNGTINDLYTNKNRKLRFTRYGTSGKPVKIESVTLDISTNNEPDRFSAQSRKATLRIKGRNFIDGAMVFVDNSGIKILSIKCPNGNVLTAKLKIFDSVLPGTDIGLKIINPDNAQALKPKAFTIN